MLVSYAIYDHFTYPLQLLPPLPHIVVSFKFLAESRHRDGQALREHCDTGPAFVTQLYYDDVYQDISLFNFRKQSSCTQNHLSINYTWFIIQRTALLSRMTEYLYH